MPCVLPSVLVQLEPICDLRSLFIMTVHETPATAIEALQGAAANCLPFLLTFEFGGRSFCK